MNDGLHIDHEALADEIARYLEVVETFRAANCEPTWRPEHASPSVPRDGAERSTPVESKAH